MATLPLIVFAFLLGLGVRRARTSLPQLGSPLFLVAVYFLVLLWDKSLIRHYLTEGMGGLVFFALLVGLLGKTSKGRVGVRSLAAGAALVLGAYVILETDVGASLLLPRYVAPFLGLEVTDVSPLSDFAFACFLAVIIGGVAALSEPQLWRRRTLQRMIVLGVAGSVAAAAEAYFSLSKEAFRLENLRNLEVSAWLSPNIAAAATVVMYASLAAALAATLLPGPQKSGE